MTLEMETPELAQQSWTSANTLAGDETVVFRVTEGNGRYVARWDDPSGKGGITTQADTLEALDDALWDAVLCHFDEEKVPTSLRYFFLNA